MSHIIQQQADFSDLAGMGLDLVKLKNSETNEIIAYIGVFNGEESVNFIKPVSIKDLIAVSGIFGKKKFSKSMGKKDLVKAEVFINKKFNNR